MQGPFQVTLLRVDLPKIFLMCQSRINQGMYIFESYVF